MRRKVVAHLFPAPGQPVEVKVSEGVVTLTGHVRDAVLIPAAARLIRAIEGVVDFDNQLTTAHLTAGPPA